MEVGEGASQAKPSAYEAEKIHGSCGRDYPALSLFSISYLRKILTVKQARLVKMPMWGRNQRRVGEEGSEAGSE